MKFRAWCPKQKRYMVDEAIFINADGESFNYTDEAMVLNGWLIEQSTDMFDVDGCEIFEGDILSLLHEWSELDNKEVIYSGRFMSYILLSEQEKEWVEKGSNHFKYWDTDEDNIYLLNQVDSYEVKVIGNIHETKHETIGEIEL